MFPFHQVTLPMPTPAGLCRISDLRYLATAKRSREKCEFLGNSACDTTFAGVIFPAGLGPVSFEVPLFLASLTAGLGIAAVLLAAMGS